jgi:type II secretory pathway component GspD/PulD (secretin)
MHVMKKIEETKSPTRGVCSNAVGKPNSSELHTRFQQELTLEFHQAPLRNVLKYISDAAGIVINAQPNVPLHREVDLWRDKPVDSQEAISLLGRSLGKQDCTLVQRGRVLKIMRSNDLKKCRIPLPALR